jgi:hypothetical protein
MYISVSHVTDSKAHALRSPNENDYHNVATIIEQVHKPVDKHF